MLEYETAQSSTGLWRFRFTFSDFVVLAGGEGYPTRDEMERGAEEAAGVLWLHGFI